MRGSRNDFIAVEHFPFSFLIWMFSSICLINYRRSKTPQTQINKRSRFHLASPKTGCPPLSVLGTPGWRVGGRRQAQGNTFSPRGGQTGLQGVGGWGHPAPMPQGWSPPAPFPMGTPPGTACGGGAAACPICSWRRELPLFLFIILIYLSLKMHHFGGSGRAICQAGAGPPEHTQPGSPGWFAGAGPCCHQRDGVTQRRGLQVGPDPTVV